MSLGQRFLDNLGDLLFGPPRAIGATLELEVNQALVNPPKVKDNKTYQFMNCPESIVASRRAGSWISIDLKITREERASWVYTPVLKFLTGKMTGVIYQIDVDVSAIKRKGMFFFTGCDEPDWPHYITSVILAHLETLKFSQKIPSGHPVLVSKIIRNYAPQIFEEML